MSYGIVSVKSAIVGFLGQAADAGLKPAHVQYFQAQDLERFRQSISNIAAYNNIDYQDFQGLQLEVIALFQNPGQPGIIDLIHKLYEKYAWALRPLSVLFATVMGED
tara:strand:+ start:840 stop:1160 length:321 start_codon:yes stop_codon:yes gene_type:complete